MKPHYVLHEGQPVRVAWLRGKGVGLVPAANQDDGACLGCAFYRSTGVSDCGEIVDDVAALGSSCTHGPVLKAFREFPQPSRSGE